MMGGIESVLRQMEHVAVERLGVSTSGCTILDVGCAARPTARAIAALTVGIDRTPERLRGSSAGAHVAAADVRALPFSSLTFDVVYCRMVLGRVREMEKAYAELSRVCCMGGVVIVSDILPWAPNGQSEEHELFTHSIERQAITAYDVGLRLERRHDGVADASMTAALIDAGLPSDYEPVLARPLVLALQWRKNAT